MFTVCSLCPAIYGILKNRDLFDPRVFLLVYWLSYTSQFSSYFLQGGVMPVRVIEPYACPLLVCASFSSLCFAAVTGLILTRNKGICEIGEKQNLAIASRDLALVLMVGASLVIFFYALKEGGLNFEKALHRDSKDGIAKIVYRLLIVATMLSTMVAISLDSLCYRIGQSKLKLVLFSLALQIVWCWLMSERNVVLTLVLTAALYRGKGTWKLAACTIGIAFLMLLLVQLNRNANHKKTKLDSNSVSEYVHAEGLPKFSASLTVFTNVIDTVPERHDFFYGWTYLTSLQTFLPGDPLNARERSIATWFPENYYYQANSGVDFALDAEGYVNFGWVGPPLVFIFIAFVLSKLYNRRCRFGLAAIVYPVVVLVALGAIRTNSQTTFKMTAGAFVCCYLVLAFASKIAPEAEQAEQADLKSHRQPEKKYELG